MTRLMLSSLACLALAGSARADDQRVKPSATVEVLDDKAQIDDVISRLKPETQKPSRSDEPNERLRPPPPAPKELDRNGKNRPHHPPRRERDRAHNKH